MAQERDTASRLRTLIVVVATLVWVLSAVLAVWIPKFVPEPGLGAAYMAVLAAALAFPEIERIRHRGTRGKSRKELEASDDDD
jgi:hypothetical protein